MTLILRNKISTILYPRTDKHLKQEERMRLYTLNALNSLKKSQIPLYTVLFFSIASATGCKRFYILTRIITEYRDGCSYNSSFTDNLKESINEIILTLDVSLAKFQKANFHDHSSNQPDDLLLMTSIIFKNYNKLLDTLALDEKSVYHIDYVESDKKTLNDKHFYLGSESVGRVILKKIDDTMNMEFKNNFSTRNSPNRASTNSAVRNVQQNVSFATDTRRSINEPLLASTGQSVYILSAYINLTKLKSKPPFFNNLTNNIKPTLKNGSTPPMPPGIDSLPMYLLRFGGTQPYDIYLTYHDQNNDDNKRLWIAITKPNSYSEFRLRSQKFSTALNIHGYPTNPFIFFGEKNTVNNGIGISVNLDEKLKNPQRLTTHTGLSRLGRDAMAEPNTGISILSEFHTPSTTSSMQSIIPERLTPDRLTPASEAVDRNAYLYSTIVEEDVDVQEEIANREEIDKKPNLNPASDEADPRRDSNFAQEPPSQ